MVVERGQVWWADLGEPEGSEPGVRRPVLIVQSDAFNRSRVSQVVTLDKDFLTELAGRIKGPILADVDSGLRVVLGL